MSKAVDSERRHFLGAAVMTLAASELSLDGPASAQS
jgi:hypothetical protein